MKLKTISSDGSEIVYEIKPKTTPPLGQEWFEFLPDPLLPPSHPDYPVRDVAPIPDVFSLSHISDTKGSDSPACPFTEPWQWFAFDIMCGSAFGQMVGNLEVLLMDGLSAYIFLTSDQIDALIRCFTGTFSSGTAFCNRSGFPTTRFPEKRKNYITGQLDGEMPKFSKAIRCGTDSGTGVVHVNDKGWEMIKFDCFIFSEGPPDTWDMSILDDPRVAVATMIYLGGVVNHFPPRGDIPAGTPIRYPFVVVDPELAAYYPLWYSKRYYGERQPIGFWPSLISQLYNFVTYVLKKI